MLCVYCSCSIMCTVCVFYIILCLCSVYFILFCALCMYFCTVCVVLCSTRPQQSLLIKLLCLRGTRVQFNYTSTARPLTTLRKWLMLNYECNLLGLMIPYRIFNPSSTKFRISREKFNHLIPEIL